MAKSPAFQFYPDAWLSSLDITLMTPSEEGAYLRLLCHAWLSPDCGLPADSNALKSLSRLGVSWTKSEGRIRAKFREQDGRLYNDRLLAERTKQTIWREKSAEGGRRSVESKRQPNFKGGSRVVEECLQPNVNSLSLSSSLSLVKEKTPKSPSPKKRAKVASIPFTLEEASPEMVAYAVEVYRWDSFLIHQEFEKLRRWALRKEERRPGWQRTWEVWVDKYAKENPQAVTQESMYPNTRTSPDGYIEYQSKTGEWKR